MSEETTETQAPEQSQSEPSIWENPSLSKFKSPTGEVKYDDVGKSYLELEQMVSKRVPLPTQESPDEDWQKYYTKVRPTSPDDYHLELPGIDDVDAESLAKWKHGLYEEGLTQRQANKVMKLVTQDVIETQSQFEQEHMKAQTEAQVKLKQDWGANYEANRGMITSMLREMGGDHGDNLVEKVGSLMETDPVVAGFLYETAKVLRTSPLLKDEGRGNFGQMTISEAQSEKQSILKDPNNPMHKLYHDRNPKVRQQAIDRLLQLNAVITQA